MVYTHKNDIGGRIYLKTSNLIVSIENGAIVSLKVITESAATPIKSGSSISKDVKETNNVGISAIFGSKAPDVSLNPL